MAEIPLVLALCEQFLWSYRKNFGKNCVPVELWPPLFMAVDDGGPGFGSLVELRLPFHHGSGGWFVIAIHDSKKFAFTNVQTLKLHKYHPAGGFLLLRVPQESPSKELFSGIWVCWEKTKSREDMVC